MRRLEHGWPCTLMLVATCAFGPASHALERCSVAADRVDGTLTFSADGVVGHMRWGYGPEPDDIIDPFVNEAACLREGRALGCELGAPGTMERVATAKDCRIYVRDDVSACSAYVKGCVGRSGGLDAVIPERLSVAILKNLRCPEAQMACYTPVCASYSEQYCFIGGFQFEDVQTEDDEQIHRTVECKRCTTMTDQWCCGGSVGGEGGARELEMIVVCGKRSQFDVPADHLGLFASVAGGGDPSVPTFEWFASMVYPDVCSRCGCIDPE